MKPYWPGQMESHLFQDLSDMSSRWRSEMVCESPQCPKFINVLLDRFDSYFWFPFHDVVTNSIWLIQFHQLRSFSVHSASLQCVAHQPFDWTSIWCLQVRWFHDDPEQVLHVVVYFCEFLSNETVCHLPMVWLLFEPTHQCLSHVMFWIYCLWLPSWVTLCFGNLDKLSFVWGSQ